MARPVVIQTEKILKVAQRIFLKHGYKASTERIALEAGISEGSLFKRFKSKAELFLAAMDLHEKDQAWLEALERFDPVRDDARTVLRQAAGALLRHLNIMLPKFMALKASGLNPEDLEEVFAEPPPLMHLRILGGFFEKAAEHGLVRSHRPKILATAFQGALVHYVMCRHRFGYIPQGESEYVEELLDLYLASGGRPR